MKVFDSLYKPELKQAMIQQGGISKHMITQRHRTSREVSGIIAQREVIHRSDSCLPDYITKLIFSARQDSPEQVS